MGIIEIYSQGTQLTRDTITVNNRVYIIKKSGGKFWSLHDKTLMDAFVSQYKGKNKGIDQGRILEATNKLKIVSSNDDLIKAIRTVFSIGVLESPGAKLYLTIRINKEGNIQTLDFRIPENTMIGRYGVSDFSKLQNKLIEVLKFKTFDPEIESYTFTVVLMLWKVKYDQLLFPASRYYKP